VCACALERITKLKDSDDILNTTTNFSKYTRERHRNTHCSHKKEKENLLFCVLYTGEEKPHVLFVAHTGKRDVRRGKRVRQLLRKLEQCYVWRARYQRVKLTKGIFSVTKTQKFKIYTSDNTSDICYQRNTEKSVGVCHTWENKVFKYVIWSLMLLLSIYL
jgi:hypothetical protein